MKIQRSPAGAGTWTDVCTDTSSPYSCSFDTTTVSDGLYDFRAIATDNISLSTTSATVTNRRVDNTAPTAGMTDPGAYLAGTTVSLTATGTDGGSGVANVKIQRSPPAEGTWTDVCTDTSSPLRLHVRLDRQSPTASTTSARSRPTTRATRRRPPR